MHASTTLHVPACHRAIRVAASLPIAVLLALLAACDGRTPTTLSPQSQLAEPLEAAYRQFSDPATVAHEQSCDSAPVLAQALEGWVQAVDAAGLQSRFATETAEAKHRAAAIHARCVTSPTKPKPASQDRHATTDRARDDETRPAITIATLEAYARGLDEEIALMRASGTHFVSLSKYGDEGRQVAAKTGLSLPQYRALRQDMHKVLYELMMHERYAGPAGKTRLAGLEPHKREHAQEVLARNPYASVSVAERDAIQARLALLQSQYDGYMSLAAIAD